MRTSIFRLHGGEIYVQVSTTPAWKPSEFEGEPVPGVEDTEVHASPGGTSLLIRLSAASGYPMHSGPFYAHCQVVSGRGSVGLPDGRKVDYVGPELYVFEPGTMHDWHDITEDTVLSICLVPA